MASGSLLFGVPFTVQYARDTVDKSHWDHPLFRSINVVMSGVWGGLFAINFILVTCSNFGTGPAASLADLVSDAVLIIGFVFTIWYPDYVQKKGRAAHGNTQ